MKRAYSPPNLASGGDRTCGTINQVSEIRDSRSIIAITVTDLFAGNLLLLSQILSWKSLLVRVQSRNGIHDNVSLTSSALFLICMIAWKNFTAE
jgi:hypothetical protein